MARFLVSILLLAATAIAAQNPAPRALNGPSPASPASLEGVSFNKDVLPILQKNCQVCHRPGEAAPVSFLTYETTRPWAKAIKQAVVTRKMPPWFADPGYSTFKNDPSLTPQEIETIAAWVDNGAPEGDAKDKPKTVQFRSGWRIQPDVIVSIPEAHVVPAKGNGEIKAFTIPNPFPNDTWVSAIEVRPGNPSVVHHVMVQVPEDLPQQQQYSWGAPAACVAPAASFAQQQEFTEGLPLELTNKLNGTNQPAAPKPPRQFAILEAIYAPGTPPMDFSQYDSAKLIPGGGNLRIEVHYTPNGTATTDQTKIGFQLAKEPPQKRFLTLAPKSIANVQKRIPAGDANYETRGELEFGQDAQLVWFMPHMHLRGKDMTFSLLTPGGAPRTVLSTQFNFNWQLGYEMAQPMRVRKGTRLMVVAHHDNSANNKFNPDPNSEVTWGDLTSQEMVLPWVGVVVDKGVDPEKLLLIRQGGCGGGPLLLNLPRVPAGTIPGLAPVRPTQPNLTIPGLPISLPVPVTPRTPATPNVPVSTIPVPTPGTGK
jgi:mono/diheme cytochrome c family protein